MNSIGAAAVACLHRWAVAVADRMKAAASMVVVAVGTTSEVVPLNFGIDTGRRVVG